MKSKPILMDHFFTVHTSFIVDFKFTNNITVLMGDSGTGKNSIVLVYKRVHGIES